LFTAYDNDLQLTHATNCRVKDQIKENLRNIHGYIRHHGYQELSVIISHQTLAQNSNAVAGMTAFLKDAVILGNTGML
jgi:hypothetical protein